MLPPAVLRIPVDDVLDEALVLWIGSIDAGEMHNDPSITVTTTGIT